MGRSAASRSTVTWSMARRSRPSPPGGASRSPVSAVTGIVATDRLVIEVWSQGAPSSRGGVQHAVPLRREHRPGGPGREQQRRQLCRVRRRPDCSTRRRRRRWLDDALLPRDAGQRRHPHDRGVLVDDAAGQADPGTRPATASPARRLASQTLLGSANTVAFNTYLGKFLSPTLSVATIPAGTWEIGSVLVEDAGGANRFLALSVYVVKADDTVRGYVYDCTDRARPGSADHPDRERRHVHRRGRHRDHLDGSAGGRGVDVDARPGRRERSPADVHVRRHDDDRRRRLEHSPRRRTSSRRSAASCRPSPPTRRPRRRHPAARCAITAVAPLSLGAGGATTPQAR